MQEALRWMQEALRWMQEALMWMQEALRWMQEALRWMQVHVEPQPLEYCVPGRRARLAPRVSPVCAPAWTARTAKWAPGRTARR
eukprot:5168639-Pyramimonas_sp.AAC.1